MKGVPLLMSLVQNSEQFLRKIVKAKDRSIKGASGGLCLAAASKLTAKEHSTLCLALVG